jgi:hypothetical protein
VMRFGGSAISRIIGGAATNMGNVAVSSMMSSIAAWGSFLAFVLGGIASALGGRYAVSEIGISSEMRAEKKQTAEPEVTRRY